MEGFLLFILFILLILSLLLVLVKGGRYKKASVFFRILSIVLGISIFTYWFVEKSIDKFLRNSVTLQLINELPQPLDFYVVKVEKKEGENLYVTDHLGIIRTDHYRLDYLKMSRSEEYWIAGYLGKNLAYFSDQYLINKNFDQVISVKGYTIADENLAEIAKKHVEEYKDQDLGFAIWMTLCMLLIVLNIGAFIKL